MSNPKLITLPNKHLRQVSKKVGIITPDVQKIVDDMKKVTLAWEDSRQHEVGVALAAIQIDRALKVVIIRSDFEDKSNREFTVFINPEITKLDGQIIEDYEGCLSIKDIYGKVPRYSRVKVKATDLNGKEFRVTAEGFLARIFQHEIDHTKGKLFVDYIKDQPDSFFKLGKDGGLEELDYEKHIKENNILWK
jgi:peptide deformylase